MSALETLISDTGQKFGIGPLAASLVREALELIRGAKGGPAGFVEQFRAAGLGNEVVSWIGGRTDEVPAPTIERVIGADAISSIGRRLSLAPTMVGAAFGFVLPKLVSLLSPGGKLGTTFPADIRSFIDSGTPAHPAVETSGRDHDRHGMVWFLPLAGVAAFGALLYYLLPGAQQPAPAPAATAPAATSTAAQAPAAPTAAPVAASTSPSTQAWLRTSDDSGVITYSGVVPDDTTQDSVVQSLRNVFGADKVRGTITVDPATAPPPWLPKLPDALAGLKMNGAQALFDGSSVSIGGLADSTRDAVINALKALFGQGFAFGSLSDRVADLVSGATRNATVALSTLKTGYSPADVVNALNLSIVNFDTASTALPSSLTPLIDEAARKLRTLPPGTVIEVAGHTDNEGDAAANVTLSQQRADAVRNALIQAGVNPAMLVAKGYGQVQPVASNDTPDGRFRNRRIEYRLISG